jgi:hypothetical protein
MKLSAAIVIFAMSASASVIVAAAPPSGLEIAIRSWRPNDPPSAFSYALVHLKDVGPPDALVLIRDPNYCGSGGCVLIVLKGELNGSFKLISTSTISREPLYILRHESHGWHDFTTFVSGGGVTPCNAIMRFNGRRYPGNPSTVPCASQIRLRDATSVSLDQ